MDTIDQTILRNWIGLCLSPGLGSLSLTKLIEKVSDLSSIFRLTTAELLSLGLTHKQIQGIKTPNWKKVDQTLAWAEHSNHHLLAHIDPRYPALLKECVGAPSLLYIWGNDALLNSAQIAIVGSRNPSRMGQETASAFAKALSQTGFTITSGLALGIDKAGHLGALEATGKTIAVLGTGIDQIYPTSHQGLAQRIIEQGAIISEFPLGTSPKPSNFPQRNRIISGLSAGILVVEAALRSGSLITAGYALEQGREIFAIPSSIHNPLAKGCHHLIKQGAKLTESASDILVELGNLVDYIAGSQGGAAKKMHHTLDYDQSKLLECVGFEATTIDLIIHRSGLESGIATAHLLLMELAGLITTVPGGYVRR